MGMIPGYAPVLATWIIEMHFRTSRDVFETALSSRGNLAAG